jgi:hypothetical protein
LSNSISGAIHNDAIAGISDREWFDWVEVNWEKERMDQVPTQFWQNYFFGEMLLSPTQQPCR